MAVSNWGLFGGSTASVCHERASSRTTGQIALSAWTAKRCKLRGCRAYVLCAGGRTVEKLYAPGGRLWRCRHCHDLSYESRQTAPHYRQLVKAQKIRERLAGSRNMLVEFPPKPKGMHWRRYYRLQAAHDQAANCSLGVLAGYFRGLRAR